VDEGWERGEVVGRRIDFDPSRLGRESWAASAPLAGILFPRIQGDGTTGIRPLRTAAAFVRLVRQSPWFLADRTSASAVLPLLERVARVPAYELDLARDSYHRPELLQTVLEPLFSAAPASGTQYALEPARERDTP
jgi:hypothetical protein